MNVLKVVGVLGVVKVVMVVEVVQEFYFHNLNLNFNPITQIYKN
ncbi:hypothetical protein [Deferribacter autotrophicus]|nr:hypothetical protein [Deferribacter autotrophicus]